MDTLSCSYNSYVLFLGSLIILAIMLSEGILCSSVSFQCSERDNFLLLKFKHTIVDPSSKLSTWSSDRDCCEWEGIQCDNTTGRVIKINLPCPLQPDAINCGEEKAHCLTGHFHQSLLQLEFLNYLNLSNQNFQSIIMQNDHVGVQNSSNLHYLDLSYNEELHFDSLNWISRFPSLKYVDFGGINLRGIVDWYQLATLVPFLSELYFDHCQLSNISPSLRYANFTSLQVLSLSSNDFSTQFFPHWLLNLSHLTIVDMSYNNLQGQLPERLLYLHKIQRLHLNSNKFTGPIPNWIGQLESLQVLDVGDNSFSGPIPSTLGNISSLIFLDVSSNHLNGSLPKSLGQLFNLETLRLHDNNLTGYVSERNFAKLSNLYVLGIGSPGLIFDFDSQWIPPFQLDMIYLNHLVGPKLPAWIYTQMSLTTLKIRNSIISLESQDKFWDFIASVPHIRLHHNTIHGEMSNVLLNSTIISFRSNKIKSNLPRLSPYVMSFGAKNNSFQGPISRLLCQQMNGTSQLQRLRLSHNLLSGELTNCWMNWKSLIIVNLEYNNLTGIIPPSLGLLTNLVVLNLNNNNLFGEIPLALKNCQKLQVLNLVENRFSGFLPQWIAKNIKFLQLKSNHFTGTIPPQICHLVSLVILDIANNKISGSIPTCLKNLTAMVSTHSSWNDNGVYAICIRTPYMNYVVEIHTTVKTKGQELRYRKNLHLFRAIDLSSNYISGSIPQEIFSLTGLQSLNLSYNQLEGNIPNEIGNMENLESLDLASNRLSGEIPQSLIQLFFLGTLNLSFNNFTGKIPSGTQLQGFDVLSYIGNPLLCGAPLPNDCTYREHTIEEGNESHEDEFLSYFYVGMGVGFATAFWGVCVIIFFNKSFRKSYFRFLNNIGDKLYVMVVLLMNRFR